MKIKSKRLFAIRKILATEKISSQEDLSIKLKRSGFKVTQSTLSRDLKELNVVKHNSKNETPYYYIPESAVEQNIKEEQKQHGLSAAIKSVAFSGNIAVIKTLSGYANAVTVIIDDSHSENILGTIAGDDTIFIVMHEYASHKDILDHLSKLFKNIGKLLK
ncbi:MAG: arginine repressor [Bacteroidales bacterium]|nr:arginine repressor [Bacteroidales bacterium]